MNPRIENGRPVYYVVQTLDIVTNGILFKQGEFHGLLSQAVESKKKGKPLPSSHGNAKGVES